MTDPRIEAVRDALWERMRFALHDDDIAGVLAAADAVDPLRRHVDAIVASQSAPGEIVRFDSMRAERDRALDALAAVEWVYGHILGYDFCPSCECEQPDHADGCALRVVLREAGR